MPAEPLRLRTILLSTGQAHKEPEGLLPYAAHPRIGEWVELARNQKSIMCEVVMIAHSTTGGCAEVYVREIGDIATAIDLLHRK